MRYTVLTLALIVGCGSPAVPCSDDAYCGVGGRCVAGTSGSKWCASSDGTCASGSRWQESAGDGLAGTCVADAGHPDAAVVRDMVADISPDMRGVQDATSPTVDAAVTDADISGDMAQANPDMTGQCVDYTKDCPPATSSQCAALACSCGGGPPCDGLSHECSLYGQKYVCLLASGQPCTNGQQCASFNCDQQLHFCQ